jgi:hypothetical protein
MNLGRRTAGADDRATLDEDELVVSGMWPCDTCGGRLTYIGTRHWLVTQWRCEQCGHEWEVEQEYLDCDVAYMIAAIEDDDPSYLEELDP